MLKTIVVGLILGITLGFSLAAEIFGMFGLEPKAYLLLMAGLVFAVLLINRSAGMLAAITMLSIAVLQPENVLVEHGFDKDLLLTTLLAIVIYPIVHKVLQS